MSRALTGAWIETAILLASVFELESRALTGAWIETVIYVVKPELFRCRALTGAWIETNVKAAIVGCVPSRPHGRVD